MADLLLGRMIKAYKEFAERIGSIESGRGSKSQRVREAIKRKIVRPLPARQGEPLQSHMLSVDVT